MAPDTRELPRNHAGFCRLMIPVQAMPLVMDEMASFDVLYGRNLSFSATRVRSNKSTIYSNKVHNARPVGVYCRSCGQNYRHISLDLIQARLISYGGQKMRYRSAAW